MDTFDDLLKRAERMRRLEMVQCPACHNTIVGSDYLLQCSCGTHVRNVVGFHAPRPDNILCHRRCDECGTGLTFVEAVGRIHSFKCSECERFYHFKSGAV